MFFIGVFGIGNRNRKMAEVAFDCVGCLSKKVELIEVSKSFEFFFIPVIKFSKEYLIRCQNCFSIYKIKNSSLSKVLQTGKVEYEDIEKILVENSSCPKCGALLGDSDRFCSKCGTEIR